MTLATTPNDKPELIELEEFFGLMIMEHGSRYIHFCPLPFNVARVSIVDGLGKLLFTTCGVWQPDTQIPDVAAKCGEFLLAEGLATFKSSLTVALTQAVDRWRRRDLAEDERCRIPGCPHQAGWATHE